MKEHLNGLLFESGEALTISDQISATWVAVWLNGGVDRELLHLC